MRRCETHGRRVLFVDDNCRVTEGIRRALRDWPFEILTANSASEALRLMAEREIAVIVSDEQMPEMRGSELLAVVLERHPETVRLILTGKANLDTAIDAVNRAGVHRFLRKPVAPEELALCVSQALEAWESRRRYEVWKADVDAIDDDAATRLDQALSGLRIAFQPIFSAAERRVFGYEALARVDGASVDHPQALFRLAGRLGRAEAVERLCRNKLAERIADAPRSTVFFVNVRPRSLNDESVLSGDEPLARYADRVVLEMTERESLREVTEIRTKVSRLRELGFRIAVDDLGAGYSGLGTLPLIEPDIVKFDMTLIRDIHRVPTKAGLVGSMAALCRELGVKTVAEGIETVDEERRAVELGCDLLQGFFLARPSPDLLEEDATHHQARCPP